MTLRVLLAEYTNELINLISVLYKEENITKIRNFNIKDKMVKLKEDFIFKFKEEVIGL